MSKSARVASLAVALYWSFFFGAELVATLNLYQEGNGIYQILNTTAAGSSRVGHHEKIPLIMHRMWKDDRIIDDGDNPEIPASWQKAFNNCNEQYRKRNWTTIIWTDESIRTFMKENYSYFLTVYDSYPFSIQRVDAARYFILYHYGGLYLDLDVGCPENKDFIDLIDSMETSGKEALIPLTEPVGLSNDVLFATKSSPFYERLMDALPGRNRWYGSPYLTVLYSSGPMFLSLQYSSMTKGEQEAVLVLPDQLYTRKRTRYFRHLRGSTWHSSDVHVVKWLANNWPVILVVLLLVGVCRVATTTPQKHESKRM